MYYLLDARHMYMSKDGNASQVYIFRPMRYEYPTVPSASTWPVTDAAAIQLIAPQSAEASNAGFSR